jgi:5'-nucleotidase
MRDETTPTFLLTNDDGWDAPGLEALREAAGPFGPCRIVAPSGPHSGCGHRVTTHEPIAVRRGPDGQYIVDGTPADCVRLALHHLTPGANWLLSGINPGGNLGTDVYHSGTVAAVREGVLHGMPGIAISHYIARGRALDWPRASRWAGLVLRRLLEKPWEPGTFWNVNLPHPEPGGPDPEIVFCPLDPSPLPLRFRVEGDVATYTGDYQSRARRPSSDVDVCFGGRIAVSLIRMEWPALEDSGGSSHSSGFRPPRR